MAALLIKVTDLCLTDIIRNPCPYTKHLVKSVPACLSFPLATYIKADENRMSQLGSRGWGLQSVVYAYEGHMYYSTGM